MHAQTASIRKTENLTPDADDAPGNRVDSPRPGDRSRRARHDAVDPSPARPHVADTKVTYAQVLAQTLIDRALDGHFGHLKKS